MRKHSAGCAAALIMCSHVACASQDPGTAPSVATLGYVPDVVTNLLGKVGFALDIELEPGERVVNVASGNLAAIEIGAEANHVLIKPRRAVAQTNLVVITDRRTYRYTYRTDDGQPTAPATVAIRYQFPNPPKQSDAAPSVRFTDYWYCGTLALRPDAAYDDGVRTYLRFASHSELPVLYRLASDGSEELVNSHVEGDWLVVHEAGSRLLLRKGHERGCVTRHVNPTGERR